MSTSKNGSTVMTITEDSLLYCSKKKKKKKRKEQRKELNAPKLLNFCKIINNSIWLMAKKCFTFYRVHFRTCTFLLLPEYRSPISTFTLAFTLLSVEKVNIVATSAINTCKTLRRRDTQSGAFCTRRRSGGQEGVDRTCC